MARQGPITRRVLSHKRIFNSYSAKARAISPDAQPARPQAELANNRAILRKLEKYHCFIIQHVGKVTVSRKFIVIYNLLLSKRLNTIFYLPPFLIQQAANENFVKLKFSVHKLTGLYEELSSAQRTGRRSDYRN